MSLKKQIFIVIIVFSLLSVLWAQLTALRILQNQQSTSQADSTARLLKHVHWLARQEAPFASVSEFEDWLIGVGRSLDATLDFIPAPPGEGPEGRSPSQDLAGPQNRTAVSPLQKAISARCEPVPSRPGMVCRTSVTISGVPGVGTGELKIIRPVRDIHGSVFFFRPSEILYVSVLVILAGFLSWILARSYSRELWSISQAADEIGHGHFHKRIQTYPGKDFIPLVQSINRLAKRIQNNIETIAQQRDQLETIFNGMQEGVLVLDERGKVKIVNHAFRQIFGLTQNVQGRNPIEFLHSADLGDAITQSLQNSDQTPHHLFVAMTGSRYFDVSIIPLYFREEHPLSLILVFHDVTELKRLEQVRRDFVANVSHELRTPLTSIKGYAETLLSRPGPDPETTKSFVEVIQKNANTMNQLLEDILQLARLEALETQPALEPVQFSTALNTAWEICAPQAESRQVKLTTNLPDQEIVLRSDFEQLVRVLVNVLDNAIKYGPANSSVQVGARESGSDWVIAIQDEGPGIPHSLRERIFERFYRIGKEGYGNHIPGTGLGLSICKHIIRNHHGRIWVDSPVPGTLHGSIFYLQLKKAETH